MTLWWFPLEPLEERYTKEWWKWFPQEFTRNNINYRVILARRLTEKIEEGEFLDIYGRPYYALGQIQEFVRMCKEGKVSSGDKLLFADLWHHGIEAIPYIRDLGTKDSGTYGIFHAGSYDPSDFLASKNTEYWAMPFEESICEFVDAIFVGSQWSKKLLSELSKVNEDKMVVTGLPINCEEILSCVAGIKKSEDYKYVVFPHRIAPEKGITDMTNIMDNVFSQDQDVRLVLTTARDKIGCRDPKINEVLLEFLRRNEKKIIVHIGLPKVNYYSVLAQCQVVLSCAFQETFGYGVLESALVGCTPVVPNRLSYIDTLQNDKRLFYNTQEEAVDKILKYVNEPLNVSEYVKRYDLPNTIGRMLKEMVKSNE